MDSKLTTHSIVASSKDQLFCNLGEEAVMLNLTDGVYYGLDAVGARIWTFLKEPKTVTQIRDALLMEYDVEQKSCETDLLALLQDLAAAGLIEVCDEPSA
ncbi:MAG: PqqD family protein [Ignavibacteriales bacterium]|nr:PqqD family protein [Ignavibacteriales bacterium]MBI3786927.1 PqqD family protein [Ignavibacteriales bacterium]